MMVDANKFALSEPMQLQKTSALIVESDIFGMDIHVLNNVPRVNS